jgi:hypothetical protein
MKPPAVVTATPAELDEILALAKTSFPSRQYELLEGVLGTFVYVMQALQNAKTSIKRFRQMLFGARTESQRNVLKQAGRCAGQQWAAGDARQFARDTAGPSPCCCAPAPPRTWAQRRAGLFKSAAHHG